METYLAGDRLRSSGIEGDTQLNQRRRAVGCRAEISPRANRFRFPLSTIPAATAAKRTIAQASRSEGAK